MALPELLHSVADAPDFIIGKLHMTGFIISDEPKDALTRIS